MKLVHFFFSANFFCWVVVPLIILFFLWGTAETKDRNTVNKKGRKLKSEKPDRTTTREWHDYNDMTMRDDSHHHSHSDYSSSYVPTADASQCNIDYSTNDTADSDCSGDNDKD